MKRIARLFVLATLALSLALTVTACGKKNKKSDPAPEPAVTQPQMTDSEAIVGTWVQGQTRFTFTRDGQFTMEESRQCGAPPCPTTRTAGTYTLRGGKVYVDPASGNDMVFDYSLGQSPRSLMLSSKAMGRAWNLSYGQ